MSRSIVVTTLRRRRTIRPFRKAGQGSTLGLPGATPVGAESGGEGVTMLASTGMVVVRWVGVLLGTAAALRPGPSERHNVIVGLILVGIAVARTMQMRHPGAPWLCALWLGLASEVAVAAAVVVVTGGWSSPWLVVLMAQTAVLGAFLPSRWAGSAAAAGLIGLLVTSVVLRSGSLLHGWAASTVILVMLSLTMAYASWVFSRTEQHRLLLAETNARLAATNSLLIGLDRTSSRGGEAFDPERCAESIAATAGELLGAQAIAVFAVSPLPGRWQVLCAEGVHLPTVVDELAVPSLALLDGDGTERPLVGEITPGDAAMAPGSASRMCIPLRIHGRLVGALLLEHSAASRWTEADGAVAAELARRAALMLDNARRFNALWVVGASEERTRVAHDLHDHLGQSMAALGLELDVLARRLDDPRVETTLRELRARLTAMVADLRGTMRDLRCDVSEERDLAHVLGGVVRDLEARSPAAVSLETAGGGRLSLAEEHQLLLVARQALTTAVFDAGATNVVVRWVCDGDSGLLEVGYDSAGKPCPPGPMTLEALAGIEDRCRSIGAEMRTDAEGGIRCVVSG